MLLKDTIPHPAFSYLIFLGCAIAFCTTPFNLHTGRDIFYISSYISFIALVFNFKYYTKCYKKLILPLIFFAVGMASVLWVSYFKQPGDYIDIYRSYTSSGKLQIATAFILLIAINERLDFKKHLTGIVILCGIAVNSYAIYQGAWLKIDRSELNFDRATAAAYIITAVNLVVMYTILTLKNRYRLYIYSFAFLLTLSSIILTGTRSAIIAYPIILAASIFLSNDFISSKNKTKLLLSLLAIFSLCGLIFKSEIEQRLEAFQTDLQLASQPERENSIISRVSMQKAGAYAGISAPLGQSAEQRGKEIKALVEQYPMLAGVLPYLTVHMHNEIIETFSIKGVWGVALLLALYIGLLYYSLVVSRNPMLFSVAIALFIYGCSDVIFFSSEVTISFCLAIILSILIVKKTITKE
ncbi:O-antigen ligase family protein [Serratia quinivorans]|jgi:O-antigen ligase|uniref:O-antigen ligase family protein n=1 Tax=Serratia TaxID=613 RepID=UPI00217924E6|nr:O-antigen ligase family protein [Serratia quinivorans]CAI1211641.1 O-antigen ligase [Serratia quinivorans]CAI2157586.1 O-antigen ligase [Serratia quinivorans]